MSKVPRTNVYNGLIGRVMLRFYACCLGRSWRNTPEKASEDATYMLTSALTLSILPLFFGVAVMLFPNWSVNLVANKVACTAVLFATGIPVSMWIDRRFEGLVEKARLAAPYMAPGQRGLAFVCWLSFCLASMALLALVAFAMRVIVLGK